MEDRKDETYREPVVEEWGSVVELTETGRTMPGDDGKAGSASSQGG